MNWKTLVQDALTNLGGREFCVPGAKLHSAVSKEAGGDGREFTKHLEQEGVTFGQFLDGLEGIIVHRRRGTDMLVGFVGASLPPLAVSRSFTTRRDYPSIRPDVYEAFTRIAPDPYKYSTRFDKFTSEPLDADDTIDGPLVTLDVLIDQRRRFVQTIDNQEQKPALEKSLEWSASPLGSFNRALAQFALTGRWGEFKYKDLCDTIVKWAEGSGVRPSPDWFSQRSDATDTGTPQQILAEIAGYLTDEEIRGLSLPFRVVEEVYRASTRRR
ncbi:MAG: hypothetical protein WD904_10175 [Dehalococcoidia bacterium]